MTAFGARTYVRRHEGFSLIEVAIVILVMTLVLGSLLTPLNAQLERRQIDETQRALEDIREALLGFAMANGRLPRPAQSAADGTERSANCTTHQDCTGFVPWVILGTARADAWGKLIRYSVSPGLAQTGAPIALASSGTKRIRTRDPLGAPILADNVAAVLISHGARAWGHTIDGVDIPDGSSTNVDEDANATQYGRTTDPFYARTMSQLVSSPGGEFDDLVVWIPQPLLLSRLVAAAKLP
ncbi:MAG TPA: type II secretion system protein [Burkholderiales bacterium]|nr:type II secretion system protein [Burkholderiales bacterium]